MLICEEIAQAFNGSLQPQRAKQASNYIVSLRKNENYVISILEILLNNESYPGINLMQFIIQLKVISNIKILNQYQLQKFYKNFIKIIYKVSNRGNHKTLRQIVYNMTLKDYQNWFNFQQFQYYLRNDVDGSKDYKRWMISIIIGIPQACKFKKIQVYSQKYIQKYDNIINLIWPRIYKFEILQIHYILKFLYKCIQCSSLNYSVDLIQRFLNMVLEIGQFFFKKDFFVSDQPSQPSKAAKYLLRLLKNCLIKQVEYVEKTGKKDSSHLQLWAQSNKNVVLLFNAIFSRISKEHPFIGQICQQQIHLESIQLINQYVTAIIPKHIDQNVEKMLYVDIPKMLFNLRSVIECEGISLQNIEDSLNNHSYKLKKSLLILWRTLSCLNLDFSHKQTKLNKNNKSISENSNIAQIQNKLKSPLLHTKFVFQKLSETETFFSPYTRRKKLNNQKIWNFGSNQQWIIVAFDLFRVLAGDIKSRKSFSNTKVSISEILLLYVLPKIVNKNTLIQSHAIAVLVTYQEQFQNLNISQEILTKLSNFLSPDQSKEDQDSTKNTLFCFLPSLKQNWKIKELIRQKIQPIIQYYMQILSKQQENNYYLAKAFSTIIQYYGQSIKEPEKYLNEMVQKIMEVQKTHNITKISLYMESVQKFIQRMKNIDQISSSMLKIFNLSLSMPSYQTDQLLEEEILCCMKTYIKKVTVLSELNIAMFVIYCVYICHHSKQILTKVEQMRGYQKIKKYCEHQNRNIQTYLDESILQIIQYFTVHDKFYEVSKFIGRQPYIFYFDALEACIRVFRQRADPDEQEHMLYFFNEIIKGLIPMVEYIYENTANGPDIIGQIWIFTHSEIFEPYKKQLLNFIDAPSQVAQKLLSHYQQLIKNLAQLWAISTSYFPEAIEQVIESEQKFVFNLIMLIKNCQKSYKQDNFRCTALSGLRQLLSMRVQQNQVEQIINLIAVIVESCLSKKINHNNNLWRWQYSKSDYTIDDQYFVEDKIYNVIKREWDTYQQLEYIDQIIKYIRQMKEDQLQKFQNHLIVLQSYQSKFQGDIWEY